MPDVRCRVWGAGCEPRIGRAQRAQAAEAGTTWANLDPFLEAIYQANDVGANITAFAANGTDAEALAKLKEGTGSNRNLLQPDPTQPTQQLISGVPLYVSPAVAEGTVWGLPTASTFVAIRQDTTLDIDKSVHFASDRTAIRAIMRVTFAFAHEKGIQKIALS